MDMSCDPGSGATGTRSNRGTQCDMTPVMRCSAQRYRAGFTVCVDIDNGREGENGNSSISFMMDVKIDLRGGPGAK